MLERQEWGGWLLTCARCGRECEIVAGFNQHQARALAGEHFGWAFVGDTDLCGRCVARQTGNNEGRVAN